MRVQKIEEMKKMWQLLMIKMHNNGTELMIYNLTAQRIVFTNTKAPQPTYSKRCLTYCKVKGEKNGEGRILATYILIFRHERPIDRGDIDESRHSRPLVESASDESLKKCPHKNS